MANAGAKVTCLVWLLSISGGYTQELHNPYNNVPLGSSIYNREFTNGDDAIEMGRTAAEDMGSLMASPPVNLIRLNEGRPQSNSDRRHFISQNNLFPPFGQARESDGTGNLQYECFQFVDGPEMERRGRNAGRTINPMSLPLIPLLPSTTPLGRLPAIPPLATPILQALLPVLNLRRRGLPPRLPLLPQTSLRSPPRMRLLGRSAFSPNNYRPFYLYV